MNVFPGDLFFGTKVSDCVLPCRRTSIEVRPGPVSTHSGNTSLFSLAFSQSMEVKTVSVDKFSFMTFLNFLGSNLGLWPGLGLYQIFELLSRLCIDPVLCNKFRSFFRRRTVINT